MTSPDYSFIIAFRNREISRVKNSLNSIATQKIQNFEVVLVDQGSDEHIQCEIQECVEIFSFCKYIFNNSLGQFWNKSNALNIGINASIGKKIIIFDIDLVIEPHFTEKLNHYNLSRNFLSFKTYYLSEFEKLINVGVDNINDRFVGMLITSKENLLNINGFDDYFQVWGAEDEDIMNRLEEINVMRKDIFFTDIASYHQWHQSLAPRLPSPWYIKMVEHLYSEKAIEKKNITSYKIVKEVNRPALRIFKDKSFDTLTKVELNLTQKTFLFNQLIKSFGECSEGIILDFSYPQLNFSNYSEIIVRRFNRIMKKLNLNLQMKNTKAEERKELQQSIQDFLKYFVGTKRDVIRDYYIEITDNSVLFIALKTHNEY